MQNCTNSAVNTITDNSHIWFLTSLILNNDTNVLDTSCHKNSKNNKHMNTTLKTTFILNLGLNKDKKESNKRTSGWLDSISIFSSFMQSRSTLTNMLDLPTNALFKN